MDWSCRSTAKPAKFSLKRGFLEKVFINLERIFTMEKTGGAKTFGSSVSFDLELPEAPPRRRKKVQRRKSATVGRRPNPHHHDKEEVPCPGCGHSLKEDEWLDALIGFLSGAQSFDVGDPVRARVVQTLRNTVTNMETPRPRDVWELSIVARLTREFEAMLQTELADLNAQIQEMFSKDDVEAYGKKIQEDTLAYANADLRRQIEQELWQHFEEELQRRARQD